MAPTARAGSPEGFGAWLASLAGSATLSPKSRAVVALLRTEPRACAFGSVREVAELAQVNIATVTRAAQALGFRGWTDLQHEFRSRFVASLSVSEVASEHDRFEPSAASAFARDRADLAFVAGSVAPGSVREVARRIAGARQTVVVAQGSYAAVGLALSHNAQLAGYDVRHVAEPVPIANTLAHLATDDLLVAVNCWQIYDATMRALVEAHTRGVPSVLVTDVTRGGEGVPADLQVAVPSESVAFFPSLTGALSLVQAVVVELAALDPDRTRTALAAAQRSWDAFGLLRHG